MNKLAKMCEYQHNPFFFFMFDALPDSCKQKGPVLWDTRSSVWLNNMYGDFPRVLFFPKVRNMMLFSLQGCERPNAFERGSQVTDVV